MPTNTCAAINTFSRMIAQGGSLPRTFSNTSEFVEYVIESLESDRPLQGGNSITGDAAPYDHSFRSHGYIPGGMIYFQNGPANWTAWLERIFGGPRSGTNIALNPILPSVDLLVDRENGIFRYDEQYVGQAVIRGNSSNGGDGSELIDMIVNMVGKGEGINTTSFPDPAPAIASGAANAPYAFYDGALLFNGTAYDFESVNLIVNNNLIAPTRNSLTPKCVRSAGRTIGLQVRMPFLTTSLADALAANTASVAARLTFTNGNMFTRFEFPAVRNRFRTPNGRGRSEIPLSLDLTAARNAGSNQVIITHDDTP